MEQRKSIIHSILLYLGKVGRRRKKLRQIREIGIRPAHPDKKRKKRIRHHDGFLRERYKYRQGLFCLSIITLFEA